MDETRKESIKPLIHAWLQERLKALQDQVLLTWEEGMGRLRPDDALLQQILERTGGSPAPSYPSPPMQVEKDFGNALDLLDRANSQGEVLRYLLEGLKPFAERCAVFVVKPGVANLYAQQGFELEVTRQSKPVMLPPELGDLVEGRLMHILRPGAAYKALLEPISRFEAPDVRIFPLRLRRKTVALLLADSGLNPRLESSQMVRALARATEAALSHQALGKEEKVPAVPQPMARPSAPTPPSPTPLPPQPPPPAQAKPLPQPPSQPPPQPPRFASATPSATATTPLAIVPNVNTVPLSPEPEPSNGPPLDDRLRANAERSARVLIGDIELYSPAKVASGKLQRNLYTAIKEDLDRSRASFIDRYGAQLEEQHRIFFNTLVQQLCDGDASLLGSHPWGHRTNR